jgi:hypothetical protein
MRIKTILTATTILLTCLTFWTCEKDKDEEFCAFVNEQNFDATGPLIDDFLATLKKGNEDYKLEKLRAWLERKDCVGEVQILCNSCILTLPPQSELRVDFISNGDTITLTLDILMDDPMKFRTYH